MKAFHYNELSKALEEADFIVSGVNSYGVRWAAETLAAVLQKPIPIIAVTKGLEASENGDLISLTEVYEQTLLSAVGPLCRVSGIVGPCIAGELAAKRPSCVVFGSHNIETSKWLAAHFSTKYYHIWNSDNLYALELSAALKNAYTLPVGIAQGALYRKENLDPTGAQMHNPAAAVFGQGVNEIGYILKSLRQNAHIAASLPGAGDYHVTCAGGRNIRLGQLLGSGKSLKQALAEMKGITIESLSIIGAMAAALPKLYERGVLDPMYLPLIIYLIETIQNGYAKPIPFKQFFQEIQ